MKTFKTLLLLAIAALSVVACEKQPEPEPVPEAKPVLTLESTEVSLDAKGGIVEVAYTLENVKEEDTLPLSVEYNADWLEVETTATLIKFSAEKNESGNGRVANVIIGYEGAESTTVVVKQPEFEVPIENLTLKLELTAVSPTSITFNVEASHPDMTWIPMVTYKEYWDDTLSDEEIFTSDLAYFEYLADNYGISIEEFLAEMVGTGSVEGIEITELTPETEFIVYAYGLTVDGKRTTDIVTLEATTEKAYEGDITFEFEITEENYIMEFTVTPSHKGVNYFHGLATEAEIKAWKELAGSDELRDAIQQGVIEPSIQTYLEYEFISTRADFFAMYNEMDIVNDGWEQVNAGTKYILYAAKWNEDCILEGTVSYAEYETPFAALSDNQLTMEITEITQSQVTVSMKTTNEDPYVVIPMKTEDIAGMSDSEIYSYVTTKYDYLVSEYTFMGDRVRTFSRMRPDTDYTILAFGSLAGTQTTDMIKREITTTASGDPQDCTFAFNIVPSSDNAWLEIDPSDKGHFYNWLIYPADYTAEDAKAYIKDVVLGVYYDGDIAAFSSWELTQGYITTTAWDLRPSTEYKIGVVIMDYDTAEFITDVTFSETFTTLDPVYADIDISVDWFIYFDGEELFNYGYSQFEGCENEAVVPMRVTIDGNYEEFYFAVYNRDLTNEETYPDDTFYEDLNYGYPMSSVILSVPFDTDLTVIAVAYDEMFVPSKLFRKKMYLTADGAAPANQFVNFGGAPSALTRSLVIADEEAVRVERSQSADAILAAAQAKAEKYTAKSDKKEDAKREFDLRKARLEKSNRWLAK